MDSQRKDPFKPSHPAASYLSDVLPHVFDHHFISSDWLQSKQTPVVDVRFAESDLFLTELNRGISKLLPEEKNFKQVKQVPHSDCSYLQLVELQQVTVACKGGEQASLL